MTRKNSNGHGSIRKKTVRGHIYYEARYTDPITHRQCSISATTEEECSRKLLEVLARITTGSFSTPRRVTVAQWLDAWLERKQNLEPGTRAKYESAIRLYISPALGNARLQDLRRIHCQDFVNSIKKSPKYVHNIVGVLSDALQEAVRLEMIPRNPAADLELPRIERKPPVAMDSAAQAAFEAAFRASPYANIFLIAMHTGARISEVLGLRWADIDLKTGKIQITGQLERKQGDTERARKDTTKSHRQRATIAPPFVVAFLKDQRRAQNAQRLRAGAAWHNDTGLVFTRADGTPIPHRTIEHAFDRIKAALDRPDLTLHALRRTYITNEVHAGADVKTVAASVGHSTTDITLEVYAAQREEDMLTDAQRRQMEYVNREHREP